jgi:Ca2+-binding EF-hand superfamily protein
MQISGLSSSYASSLSSMSGAPGGKGHMHLSKLAADQFSTIDTSGDGSITEDELKAALDQLASADGTSGTGSVSDDQAAKIFKKIDTDGDGKISATEWSAFQQKVQSFQQQQASVAALASKAFSDADTDGNGSISQDEFKALLAQTSSAKDTSATDDKATKLFKKIDTDGDGKISSSEWSNFQQKVATMGQHHHHHGSSGGASAESAQSSSATSTLQSMVSKLYQTADTNGDGLLSKQELTAALMQAMGSTGVNTLS